MQESLLPRLFVSFFLQSWWVFLFAIVSLFLYDQGIKQLSNQEFALKEKEANLTRALAEAHAKEEELRLAINSQNDPAWIELTLMRRLGLVPQGQKKILFRSPKP